MKEPQHLSFGQALELAKQGKLIQRAGWNGKGMFVFMRKTVHQSIRSFIHESSTQVRVYFEPEIDRSTQFVPTLTITPHLCMKAVDGTIVVGWLASQTDMLSNDWVELESK